MLSNASYIATILHCSLLVVVFFFTFIFTIVHEILETKIQISSCVLRRDYKPLVYSVKKKKDEVKQIFLYCMPCYGKT